MQLEAGRAASLDAAIPVFCSHCCRNRSFEKRKVDTRAGAGAEGRDFVTAPQAVRISQDTHPLGRRQARHPPNKRLA